MKRRLHNKLNTNARSGFTLVELIVTLAVAAIVASIGGMSLINWHNHSEYLKNTETAKTIYLAAQSALSEAESKGVLDETMAELKSDDHFHYVWSDPAAKAEFMPQDACENDDEGNQHLFAYINVAKAAASVSDPVYAFLSKYVSDPTVLTNGSYVIEFDVTSQKVYSVFYSEWNEKFDYSKSGNSTIHGTYFINRDAREESALEECLVGYCIISQVNSNTIEQNELTVIKMMDAELINEETLHLDFRSDSKNSEKDSKFTIKLYDDSETPSIDDDKNNGLLFETDFDWSSFTALNSVEPTDLSEGSVAQADAPYYFVSLKDRNNNLYYFPVQYLKNKDADGNEYCYFSLVLDGMMTSNSMAIRDSYAGSDAAATADAKRANSFSVTRLYDTGDFVTPKNIYAIVSVSPGAGASDNLVSDSYKYFKTETENDLFGGSNDAGYTISANRHLSNIRYITIDTANQFSITSDLDWNNNIIFTATSGAQQRESSIDAYFPTIPVLSQDYTLKGNGHEYSNLRLGSASNVEYKSGTTTYNEENNKAEAVGLFAVNKGTIGELGFRNATLTTNSDDTHRSACGILCGTNNGIINLIRFGDGTDETKCSVTASINAAEQNASNNNSGVLDITRDDNTSIEFTTKTIDDFHNSLRENTSGVSLTRGDIYSDNGEYYAVSNNNYFAYEEAYLSKSLSELASIYGDTRLVKLNTDTVYTTVSANITTDAEGTTSTTWKAEHPLGDICFIDGVYYYSQNRPANIYTFPPGGWIAIISPVKEISAIPSATASAQSGIGMLCGVMNISDATPSIDYISVHGEVNGKIVMGSLPNAISSNTVSHDTAYLSTGIGSICGYLNIKNVNGCFGQAKDSTSVASSDETVNSWFDSSKSIVNYASVTGNMFTGGLIGNASTDLESNQIASSALPQIQNCYNNGAVYINATPSAVSDLTTLNGFYLGGIVGYSYQTSIHNCTITITQYPDVPADDESSTAKGFYIGGISGISENSDISNCSMPTDNYLLGNTYVGGISGGLISTNISGITDNTLNVYGKDQVGGITGNLISGNIASINNKGTIKAISGYAAGITPIVPSGSTISACGNFADVTSLTSYAAAVADINNGTIDGCNITTKISENEEKTFSISSADSVAGGVVCINNISSVPGDKGIINCSINGTDNALINIINSNTADNISIGYIAGSNKGIIYGVTVGKNLSYTSASPSQLVGGISGYNDTGAVIGFTDATIPTSVNVNFENFSKVLYIGGISAENCGTIQNCSYSGRIIENGSQINSKTGISDKGASLKGSCYAGIAGTNGSPTESTKSGTIDHCTIENVELNICGYLVVDRPTRKKRTDWKNTPAENIQAGASFIGGITGFSQIGSTISFSYIDSDADNESNITAQRGIVGGVCGYNGGSVTNSGAKDMTENDATSFIPAEGSSSEEIHNTAKIELFDNSLYWNYTSGADDSTIQNNYGSSYGYIGGIVGLNDNDAALNTCATGDWYVHGYNITANSDIGGAVGRNYSSIKISQVDNHSFVRRFLWSNYIQRNISGYWEGSEYNYRSADSKRSGVSNYYIGGIIGNQNSPDGCTIVDCINYGDIYGDHVSDVGGVVGLWNNYTVSRIESCKNNGLLASNFIENYSGSGASYYYGTIGGIVGSVWMNQNGADDTVQLYVSNCDFNGNINYAYSYNTYKNSTFNKVPARYGAGIIGYAQLRNNGSNNTITIDNCGNNSNGTVYGSVAASGIMAYVYSEVASNGIITVNIKNCTNNNNIGACKYLADYEDILYPKTVPVAYREYGGSSIFGVSHLSPYNCKIIITVPSDWDTANACVSSNGVTIKTDG